jgi:DNA-binding SARP family transcriptional activator
MTSAVGMTRGGTLHDAATPAMPVVQAKLRAPASSGLRRDRLMSLLASVWNGRLAVVTGPAGSGKSTLLAQFAASLDTPTAWYHAESADGDPSRLLTHLHEGLTATLGRMSDRWDSVDAAVADLEGFAGSRTLLIIDDLQALEGTASEAAVERLTWFAPPSLVIIVASRRQPGFNLSRLRVADQLVEIDADALRFRSWEVERLFHDVYAEPLPPEDVATLARRTEGWAAGLQLFHLASRGKSPNERRQMVRSLSSRSRLVREYLTQNVVDELPADLRQFLLDTCVLGRLTGGLCDEFLERSGTAAVLEEIERRQIFLCPLDDGVTFRYHEVLRSHLEACLIDQIGEREARMRYARAGALLETAGACSEALRAYCRAGDETAAIRLLSQSGAEVADDPTASLDLLPTGLADHDPWLMLAAARRHLAAGRWRQALTTYQQAEASFNGASHIYRRERLALTMWLEPVRPPTTDWVGAICQATRRDPLAARQVAAILPGPTGQLATGLAALLAGRLADARGVLHQVTEDADVSPAIAAGAWLAAGVAGLLLGDEKAPKELHACREQAEALNLTWLARLASCAEECLDAGAPSEADAARAACREAQDHWGTALIGLFQGIGWGHQPDTARQICLESAALFRQLGASVLEAWARAGAAVAAARASDADARDIIVAAEASARATATWGALAASYHASALAEPARARDWLTLAAQLDVDRVIHFGVIDEPPADRDHDRIEVKLSCFGDFALTIDGIKVDLADVKPRVRSLIRLLALDPGQAVHRERLIEALWPGTDTKTGTRNLQVAISAARQLLEHTESPGALILREGDTYRMALPQHAEVDLHQFTQRLDDARRARARGDLPAQREALVDCLDLYRGDILAVEGPVEWVLETREHYRVMAAEAAEGLAESNFADGEYSEAARACERGLAIDRYRDRLWRLRVEALEMAGELAAAALVRRSYTDVLRDLGLGAP